MKNSVEIFCYVFRLLIRLIRLPLRDRNTSKFETSQVHDQFQAYYNEEITHQAGKPRLIAIYLLATVFNAPFAFAQIGQGPLLVGVPAPEPEWGPECEINGGVYECAIGTAGPIRWYAGFTEPSCGTPQMPTCSSLGQVGPLAATNMVNTGSSYKICTAIYAGPYPDTWTNDNYLGVRRGQSGLIRFDTTTRTIDRPTCLPDFDGISNPKWSTLAYWSRSVTCEPGWAVEGTDGVAGSQFSRYCRKPPVCCSIEVGNPIAVGTGAKIQREYDIRTIGNGGLTFWRTYNSQGFILAAGLVQNEEGTASFGALWRHNYHRELVFYNSGTMPTAYIVNAAGGHVRFRKVAGVWTPRAFSNEQLADLVDTNSTLTGWKYTTSDDTVEQYNASGKLVQITDRAGLTQLLSYADGSANAPNGALTSDTNTPISAGTLLSVTDSFGRALVFSYNSNKRLVGVLDPQGGVTEFMYDSSQRLKYVVFPDGKTKQYVYYTEEVLPALAQSDELLTGIIDENNVRTGKYGYDAYRRVTTSEAAGGVNKYSVTYLWSASVPPALPASQGQQISGRVVDPLATQKISKQVFFNGIYRHGGDERPCSSQGCSGTESTLIGYDVNGNVSYRTDFKGNRTNFSYDAGRALEVSRTEGLTATGGITSATRTITTTWDPVFRLPATITEQLGISGAGGSKFTANTYDGMGNLIQRTIITPAGTRIWNWTFDQYGRVLTATDPLARTNVNTYYPNTQAQNASLANSRGMLASTTNAAGHTVNITAYNAHGQPLEMTDANGLVTSMIYDARQRLTNRTVGSEVTTYDYDGVGQLIKVTLPDNSFLTYGYDGAHRHTQIEDGLGNRIVFTLDAIGNRVTEQVFDPLNALARTKSRAYDALNRLKQDIGGANPSAEITQYGYDANDNLSQTIDPLNRTTTQSYDALNRLLQVVDPFNGTAAPTKYEYDAQDNLIKVTDPKNLSTTYSYNGFNELISQTSPDTGATSFTYDAAGNMRTKTDARGITASYNYDTLNRVTSIAYPDQVVTYVYDTCPNGKGRLCSLTDRTGTTAYSYDLQGRVLSKAQTVSGLTQTVAYSYNQAGQLDTMTLPSGRPVTFGWSNNRVIALSFDGQPIVKSAEYEPFGPIGEWTWGNDSTTTANKHTRYFDLSGRNTKIESGANIDPAVIVYDAASRITALQRLTSNNMVDSTKSAVYGYDALDRLSNAQPGGGNAASTQSYTYDAIGNRLRSTVNGSITNYGYVASSHRLLGLTGATSKTFGYDLGGNRTADGIQSWIYGGDNRPKLINIGTVSVQSGINALGQRVLKTVNGAITRFVYDESGKLIGEYDINGVPIQETLWLNDTPVAVVK